MNDPFAACTACCRNGDFACQVLHFCQLRKDPSIDLGSARVKWHLGARHGGRTGHNLAKTGTSSVNGPIMGKMRHIKPFSALFLVLYFYFWLCVPTLQQTENDLEPVGLVRRQSQPTYRHFEAIYTFLGQ